MVKAAGTQEVSGSSPSSLQAGKTISAHRVAHPSLVSPLFCPAVMAFRVHCTVFIHGIHFQPIGTIVSTSLSHGESVVFGG